MNVQRFASLVCSLSSTPSRRAVNHALLGLAAGSFLAPVIDSASGLAKKKRRKNKKRKKKDLCVASHDGTCHKCAPQDEYCPIADLGVVPRCCSWEQREFCTSCGCCPEGWNLCCADRRKKSCCESDGECCGGNCCHPGTRCCYNGGKYNCIAEDMCCDDEERCGGECGCAGPDVYCCRSTAFPGLEVCQQIGQPCA
jgi:hypothetical protein